MRTKAHASWQFRLVATRTIVVLLVMGLLFWMPAPAEAQEYTHTYVVDTTEDLPLGDPSGKLSLRAAVQQANTEAVGGAALIEVPAGTYILTTMDPGYTDTSGTLGALKILGSMTIQGAGPELTVIEAAAPLQDNVLVIDPVGALTLDVALRGIAIRGGDDRSPDATGGGIKFGSVGGSQLLIDNCVIQGNTVSNGSGTYPSGRGGGIFLKNGSSTNTNPAPSTVVISKAVIRGNTAPKGGGGIFTTGYNLNVTITDSKVLDNSADNDGGGISLSQSGGGTSIIVSSLIAGNSVSVQGAGLKVNAYNVHLTNVTFTGNSSGVGSAIYQPGGGMVLTNVTATGNNTWSEGTIYSAGSQPSIYNSMIGGNGCSGLAREIVGPYSGDHNLLRDPAVWALAGGGLADNGGQNQTIAISESGAAMNGGDSARLTAAMATAGIAEPYTDQRGAGFARIKGPSVDIGAFEVQSAASSTSLVSDVGSVSLGDTVTLTATVDGVFSSTTPTGIVTFRDGATVLGTGGLDAGGKRTLTIGSLAVGNHSISATYSGDDLFGPSATVTPLALVVSKADAEITLTSDSASPAFGDDITFAATVSAIDPVTATPTGSVSFWDGNTAISGPVNLSGGVASLSSRDLRGGAHSIAVKYEGDSNFAASESDPLALTVSRAGIAVVLSANDGDGASVTGEPVVFVVSFNADLNLPARPSGLAQVIIDGTPRSFLDLAVGDSFGLNPSNLTVGSHAFTVVYPGDASFTSASSATLFHSVTEASTTTSLSGAGSSVVGTPMSITATVAVVSPGQGVPQGTVTFYDGGAQVATVPLDLSGRATYTETQYHVGDLSIGAVYGGSQEYLTSTSGSLLWSVGQADTTTSLVSTANPSEFMQEVRLQVSVSAVAPSTGTPTGTVTLYDGTAPLGTVALNAAGQAELMTSLAVGNHAITASYDGDADYRASGSTSLTQQVQRGGTVTTVAASPAPVQWHDEATLAISVSAATPGAGVPSGQVLVTIDATPLAPMNLDSSGRALVVLSDFAAGGHGVTVAYAGDGDFRDSTGTTTLTVSQAAGVLTVASMTGNPGSRVALVATLSPAEPGQVIAFKLGDTVVGSATTDDAGMATLPYSIPNDAAAGNITIDASFAGSVNIARVDTASTQGTLRCVPPVPATPLTITVFSNITTVTTTATTTADNAGGATALVTQSQLSDALGLALTNAAGTGEGHQVRVAVTVEAPANAASVETRVPGPAISQLASGASALTISTPIASVTFSGQALSTISAVATGDVVVTVSRADAASLSSEARQVVGDRPAYDLRVTRGGEPISHLGGNVEVAVPYTPRPGEDTEAIVIYYIDAQGRPQIVSNSVYDAVSGRIVFTTSHFSRYGVGHNKVTFRDVATGEWYANAVNFIAARGITTGNGDGNFSPDAPLTRGQLLVMVMRACGIAPDAAPLDNFADAGNTYYTGFLAAAKRLGISNGVGNNRYAPDREITREEMCTLLYNSLKLTGHLPQTDGSGALSAFGDEARVSPWAHDALAALVGAGTISGVEGLLLPSGMASRAQMAQVLYNLLAK